MEGVWFVVGQDWEKHSRSGLLMLELQGGVRVGGKAMAVGCQYRTQP